MTQQDSGLRLIGVIAGVVLWLGSYTTALLGLNRHPASATVRGALVALGVAGFIPWIWASILAIRAQDEFTQRVHLVALASAFGVTAVLVFGAAFLQRARFVGDIPLSTVWITMVVTWAASIVAASRHYR
jgi:hypothetical protein